MLEDVLPAVTFLLMLILGQDFQKFCIGGDSKILVLSILDLTHSQRTTW